MCDGARIRDVTPSSGDRADFTGRLESGHVTCGSATRQLPHADDAHGSTTTTQHPTHVAPASGSHRTSYPPPPFPLPASRRLPPLLSLRRLLSPDRAQLLPLCWRVGAGYVGGATLSYGSLLPALSVSRPSRHGSGLCVRRGSCRAGCGSCFPGTSRRPACDVHGRCVKCPGYA